MKHVSFEVAKALKMFGYPQKYGEGTMCYAEDGLYFEHDSDIAECYPDIFCVAPTYLEVWLWLCRNKEIEITLDVCTDGLWEYNEYEMGLHSGLLYNDPEEAIVAAIEYLVTNKLLY